MYTELKTYQIIIALLKNMELRIASCQQEVVMFHLFIRLKKIRNFIAIL